MGMGFLLFGNVVVRRGMVDETGGQPFTDPSITPETK
jgi:hypothetical protein